MSPFEIIYGFQPLAPLDLLPLPQDQTVDQDGVTKAEYIQKLHEKVRSNIEKRNESFAKHANKGRKQVIFEPGDWVWLHMRPERFPVQRKGKLAPRGDGPFKILEKINNNAYRLDLPGEFKISPSFNVADLSPFDVGDEQVLRTKPLEEGGNDEGMNQSMDQWRVPDVPQGPMTRGRARTIKPKFILFVQSFLDCFRDNIKTDIVPDRSKEGMDTCDSGAFEEGSVWTLLSHGREGHGVFTITQW